jgi:hypothetical protein
MAEDSARIPQRKDPYGLHVDVLVPFADGGGVVVCAHRKAVFGGSRKRGRCIPDLFICFRLTNDPLLKVS